MSRAERMIILVGIVLLVAVPTAVLLLSHPTVPAAITKDSDAVPTPGAPGAQHWHSSLVVRLEGGAFDFGDPKYMLQSKLVHFEDDDPFVVHKHTTGITIPYFLTTLKIFMDEKCIDFQNLDPAVKYCTNATSTLRFLVNGKEIADASRYDIQNNDRFLVYYGPLTGVQLQFLSNQVPEVPVFREKTVDEMFEDLGEGAVAPGE